MHVPRCYYLQHSRACMSQDVIIYTIPEHACPKMLLFTTFWSMPVPCCYYLHHSGACMSQVAIIYSILEHACPQKLLFTAFRSMHVPKSYYLQQDLRFWNSSQESPDSPELDIKKNDNLLRCQVYKPSSRAWKSVWGVPKTIEGICISRSRQ